MTGLPFLFANPALLAALIALPVIWWLLRMTPPKPAAEVFPPLRILASVLKREETPSKSPWWLTLLRMLMAAAVILSDVPRGRRFEVSDRPAEGRRRGHDHR